jgi:O-methyltransferase
MARGGAGSAAAHCGDRGDRGNEPSFAKLLDMQMLALTGGRERTEDEYAQLLRTAGYRLVRVLPTRGPVSVLEAIRV